MPKKSKTLCVDDLRHAEYYGMQGTFDELYQRSQNGEVFENLMDLILSRDNILLAYRNIKANKGSYTAGTDKKNITDIGSLTPDDVIKRVRFIVTGSKHGYRPKPVRRKDIPKPNGKTRPLGIPCIWDRLIQQCIKQIMEPICEAKFNNNSYGFRPNRSVEHAINRTYTMLQMMNLHYVIEFDIKGFFDNVNHSKLIRQIWSLGIHDKTLIFIIKRILTAPIKMPDNTTVLPDKGTPQGGIISPLLANIVLNELDWWVASQWEENPIATSRGRERIIGKTNGLDYILVGEIYLPLIAVPEERREIGFYGSIHRNYLKDYKSGLYSYLMLTGKLWTYLADLNEQCKERRDFLMEQIMEQEGITEELKSKDQMEWVRRANNVRSRVDEIILNELVYV